MTRNVTYADPIHAFADGKIVEFQDSYVTGAGWYALEADNTEVLPYFLRTDGNTEGRFQFRLKPRTVKIGSREVEAPVLEPGDRRMVWCWDSDLNKPEQQYVDGGVAEPQFKLGLCFASEEACQAAHDVFHALLRGEA